MTRAAKGVGSRGMFLEPLRGDNHAAVLAAALQIRLEGGVPLIGDERWSQEQWRGLLAEATQRELPEHAAWAGFTSGSTGSPRIVIRSHESWACSFKAITRLLEARPGDAILIPVHPVSSMALYAAAHAQETGLRFVVPQTHRLRAEDLDGPDFMHGTPWHLREVLGLIQNGARCTLRAILIGGDRLDNQVAMHARQLGLQVVSYAGAAELSFIAVDAGTGLRAFPGVELSVDDDGTLWARSAQLCSAIVGNGSSLRTAPAVEAQTSTEVWGTVGDRATLSNGVLTLHGRADDAILTAGATVLPHDVETILNGLPGVKASLVVAAPDQVLGQRVVAFIESELGAQLDRRTLLRRARAQLTPAQYPRSLRLVTFLPRTGPGKVRRLSYADAQQLMDQAP